MAARGFGTQTLTAAARPLFSTVLASGINPSPDPHTGRFDVASQASTGSTTTTTKFLRKGDRVLVGTSTQLSTGGADSARVTAVAADGVTVTLGGLTRVHAAGEFVVLVASAAQINVQVVSQSGAMFLGEDNSVAANSATLVQILQGGTTNWGQSSIANVFDTQHLWIAGTAGDTFLPNLVTI